MNWWILIVCAAFVLLLAFGFLLWRRRVSRHQEVRRKSRRSSSSSQTQVEGAEVEADTDSDSERENEHEHRHQRKRRYQKRNPTLAQTSGLPPVRLNKAVLPDMHANAEVEVPMLEKKNAK